MTTQPATEPTGAVTCEIGELVHRLENPTVGREELLRWISPNLELPRPAIEQCLADYLDHLASGEKSRSTLVSVKSALRLIMSGCDVSEPADFGPSLIKAFLAGEQHRGLSPATGDSYRGYARRFLAWLSETGVIAQNPLQYAESPPTERRFINVRGRRVPEGTPGARLVEQKANPPQAISYDRGWYWLDLYDAWREPTYHNLQAILIRWNSLSETQRRQIDPRYFAERRSVAAVFHAIGKRRRRRDRDSSIPAYLEATKGSFPDLRRLFALWYAAKLPPREIRDRWNGLPVRIRIAVAGWNVRFYARLGQAAGGRIVRQRIADRAAGPQDGRGDYFARLEREGLSTQRIAKHWNDELMLEGRRKIDPQRFRPISGSKAVTQILYLWRKSRRGNIIEKKPGAKPNAATIVR